MARGPPSMADGLADPFTIAMILMVVAILVIAFLEMKYVRKSMRARRVRAAKRVDEMPDQAHNALITTKAIASTLERGGIQSEEILSLLREAQMAYDRRNYRVVLDLTSQAKDRMLALKARQSAKGDLGKLEGIAAPEGTEETTTKELLQKEFPPNFAQARFTIEIARFAVDRAKADGRDLAEADRLLAQAQSRFDARDYTGALSVARQAQRVAEGVAPSRTPAPQVAAPPAGTTTAATLVCVSCGTALRPDDVFCRKCGTKVESPTCSTCGASLLPDD